MNKKVILISVGIIAVLGLTAVVLHLPHFRHGRFAHASPHSGDHFVNGESVTIELNPSGFMTCGQPFFDSVYDLTKDVFSVGADNVVLSDYENRMFTLIRNSERFKDDPEPFIDHVKDVMRQTIEIVKEDPEVLDSCENFQVAMVGPQ